MIPLPPDAAPLPAHVRAELHQEIIIARSAAVSTDEWITVIGRHLAVQTCPRCDDRRRHRQPGRCAACLIVDQRALRWRRPGELEHLGAAS